jgi:hypothetical protein
VAWVEKDLVQSGEYLMLVLSGGFYLDLTGSLTEEKVMERLRSSLVGWSVTLVKWEKGFLGIGDKLLIFGIANSNIPSSSIAANAEAALNSFWEIAGATARVYVSDRANTPIPATLAQEWTGTLQLVALAVITVAVVYGIRQFKELSK